MANKSRAFRRVHAKVAPSRDGARDFFRYSPVDNVLSPSRQGDSLISSLSRDMLSTNKTQEKSDFDY